MGFQILYDKHRFPVQQKREDGTLGCRGCGEPIPKGRKSWCKKSCFDKWEPSRVIFHAKQRDKEVCAECGFDCAKSERDWWKLRESVPYSEWHKRKRELVRNAEHDHIIPFSEGGLTVLENIRTLCTVCHKRRTKEWHKNRKAI